MREKLIPLLVTLFLVGVSQVGFASETTPEDPADTTVTLEQAKELAVQNSRNMEKYLISAERAKYRLYQARDEYSDANDEYYSLRNQLDYYMQKKLEEGNSDEIQAKLDSLWEQIGQKSEALESLLDKKRDAEINFEEAGIDRENFDRQLAYTVEELYINILNKEKNLVSLEKEQELNQLLLGTERVRLGMGRSSQTAVDQLAVDMARVSKEIEELKHSIQDSKGELNDMMGKGYDSPLTLIPFAVPETGEVPAYKVLLSRTTRAYDKIDEIKRNIEQREDDLDDIDDDDSYRDELLELEIDEKKLQLEEERFNLVETVNSLLAAFRSRQENYRLALTNYGSAKKNYAWDRKRFELGLVSKTDLLQSELDFLNQENQQKVAEYDLYLARRALELAEDGVLP